MSPNQRGVITKGVGGIYYARDEVGEVHMVRAKGRNVF